LEEIFVFDDAWGSALLFTAESGTGTGKYGFDYVCPE